MSIPFNIDLRIDPLAGNGTENDRSAAHPLKAGHTFASLPPLSTESPEWSRLALRCRFAICRLRSVREEELDSASESQFSSRGVRPDARRLIQ